MNRTFLAKFAVVALLLTMSVGTTYAYKLIGIRWGKGIRIGGEYPLFNCEYSNIHICTAEPAGGEPGGIMNGIESDLYTTPLPNKLRVNFLAPWGAPTFVVTYPVPLPPAIATYIGAANAYVMPGSYAVVYTPGNPNGYVDIVVTP